MSKFLMNRRGWILALLAGAMPLGTVADCDYSGRGGTFYLNRTHHDDGVLFIDDGHRHGGFLDVFIEDDYYYDDGYYYDEYYYEEDYYEDEYCDPYFWDCW